jgi:diaminopimelate epimerase
MPDQVGAGRSYPFLKGHGTENDFVLLPDHDGTVHGGLDEQAWAARVVALCDRRAGIGADGVIRVVRTAAVPDAGASGEDPAAEWFMDYRNADGSVSEMCGNGVRVLARHLLDEGLADATAPLRIGTRAGVKVVTTQSAADGELLSVDMGTATLLATTTVQVEGATLGARQVDVGNPHAVAWVGDLEALATPLAEPGHDPALFPHGVNVELVERRGPDHVSMRVHERGSGETRSCGTGACAVMVVAAADEPRDADVTYRVDVPGGTLQVTRTADDRVLLAGPAVVVARGTTSL